MTTTACGLPAGCHSRVKILMPSTPLKLPSVMVESPDQFLCCRVVHFAPVPFLKTFFVDSARMNHLPRIGEAHPITAAVRDDDGARRFVRFVACPVALKLQQHLDPTREASAGLLHPPKCVLVTGGREPAARIGNNENFEI